MPSSVIHHFHYDPRSRRLRVSFVSGMVYEYKAVPQNIYEELLKVSSKGKFLNEQIKGKFAFEKIR
jgi:KTSC domain